MYVVCVFRKIMQTSVIIIHLQVERLQVKKSLEINGTVYTYSSNIWERRCINSSRNYFSERKIYRFHNLFFMYRKNKIKFQVLRQNLFKALFPKKTQVDRPTVDDGCLRNIVDLPIFMAKNFRGLKVHLMHKLRILLVCMVPMCFFYSHIISLRATKSEHLGLFYILLGTYNFLKNTY